ncbi:MAG: Histone deacetylase-like amidohydrolase [Alphaproteobacteria bacterium MarineAlpha11_Bin1]|nr:MAG: Histone deacetylase-like amidohydrolase [Alphaproteobacteria bacterium MarineAlpha11_Bin1]|tara:strand:+ start:5125 stop:6078 length:954 start_codon:yes stop_codon:yes gene_type:complete
MIIPFRGDFDLTTALFTHPSFLDHDTSAGHPERIARIETVNASLEGDSWKALERREAPRATKEQLSRIHGSGYIDIVLDNIPAEGFVRLDPDTVVSAGSGEAVLHAAGAIIGAIDAVAEGEIDNAFCAVRPPGHHAEPSRAMGFCLFNNVAIGALHARVVHDLRRVAIVDFDVHHGNGTQAAFERDPDTLFASSHQYPHYPGTGAEAETGVGNIFNAPLDAYSGGNEFRAVMERRILPAVRQFDPDILFVSAGFDAHARDPLASLCFEEKDFEWATAQLKDIAGEFAGGKIVSTLEGGYDLEALGNSVQAHVSALMS